MSADYDLPTTWQDVDRRTTAYAAATGITPPPRPQEHPTMPTTRLRLAHRHAPAITTAAGLYDWLRRHPLPAKTYGAAEALRNFDPTTPIADTLTYLSDLHPAAYRTLSDGPLLGSLLETVDEDETTTTTTEETTTATIDEPLTEGEGDGLTDQLKDALPYDSDAYRAARIARRHLTDGPTRPDLEHTLDIYRTANLGDPLELGDLLDDLTYSDHPGARYRLRNLADWLRRGATPDGRIR